MDGGNPFPSKTTRLSNVGLMLAHRLRRWANISPTLDQRVIFAGLYAGTMCTHFVAVVGLIRIFKSIESYS